MIYLSGDTHRYFGRIWDFAERMETTRDDILIILGNAGSNYYLDRTDLALKEELSRLPLTLLCVKGNHELHADMIDSYEEALWHDGAVYREADYSNLLFAKDGESYDFDGKRAVVMGGAYSIEKRLSYQRWFCGHYHCEFAVDRMRIMYEDYEALWTGGEAIDERANWIIRQ